MVLGPNGAGKSTLFTLIAGIHRPDQGSIKIMGVDSFERAEGPPNLGWMPQDVKAVPGLTTQEQVAYAGWLQGLRRGAAWIRAGELLETVNLVQQANQRSSTLSGGQLRRVGLAEALVHQPTVLLLDEPTAGLDPAERIRLRQIITALGQECAIVMSTHQTDDIDRGAESVAVLNHGTLAFTGSADDFLAQGSESEELPHAVGNLSPAERAYLRLVGDS